MKPVNKYWVPSIIILILALVMVFSILGACTVQRTVIIDKTFTIIQQPTSTAPPPVFTLTVTVTKTLTTTVQGLVQTITLEPEVLTPIFDRLAPEIPHPYIIFQEHTGYDLYEEGVPVCFECHFKPKEHDQWLWDAEICEDCHRVSDNPRLDIK